MAAPRLHSLLIRLPNHVGDACMALPALDLLAARGIGLTLAGRRWAAELLSAYAWPVTPLPARRLERVAALRAARPPQPGGQDIDALLLTNSFSSALEMRLAGLRCAGYARDGRALLLRRAMAVPGQWHADMHTSDYYLHLARALCGLPDGDGSAQPRLRLDAAAQERARDARARCGAPPNYVVVCPTAQGRHRGHVKCWDGFGRLCEDLAHRGVATVVCPGPGEREAAAAAAPRARMIEALDLGAFAALLAASALVVANDSGPGHLAAAVGARLVGVFGVTDPAKTAPRGESVRVVGGAGGWPAYEDVLRAVTQALAAA